MPHTLAFLGETVEVGSQQRYYAHHDPVVLAGPPLPGIPAVISEARAAVLSADEGVRLSAGPADPLRACPCQL